MQKLATSLRMLWIQVQIRTEPGSSTWRQIWMLISLLVLNLLPFSWRRSIQLYLFFWATHEAHTSLPRTFHQMEKYIMYYGCIMEMPTFPRALEEKEARVILLPETRESPLFLFLCIWILYDSAQSKSKAYSFICITAIHPDTAYIL